MGLESCSAPAIDLSRALRCKAPAQANGGSDLARTGLALYSAHYGKMAGKWACLAGLSAYPTRAFLGVPNAEFPGPAVLPSCGSFSRTLVWDLALSFQCYKKSHGRTTATMWVTCTRLGTVISEYFRPQPQERKFPVWPILPPKKKKVFRANAREKKYLKKKHKNTPPKAPKHWCFSQKRRKKHPTKKNRAYARNQTSRIKTDTRRSSNR